MSKISYVVTAELPNTSIRDSYVDWLVSGHIQAVLDGGAIDAQVIELDSEDNVYRIQSRYHFEDRSAFDRYVRETAPELRKDGLRLFGQDSGVTMHREIGEILESVERSC